MHRPPVKLMLNLAHQLAILGALIGQRARRPAVHPEQMLDARDAFMALPSPKQRTPKRRDTKKKRSPRTKPFPKNLGRRDSRRRTG